MAEIVIRQILISDALNESTRKERRNLLAVSITGIIMAKTKFLPSKISALGLEFSPTDQSTILTIMAIVTVYFIIAFVLYSFADILSWLLKYQLIITTSQRDGARRMVGAVRKSMMGTNATMSNDDNIVDEMNISKSGRKLSILSKPISIVRILFDIILPIIVGIYAIICIIKY